MNIPFLRRRPDAAERVPFLPPGYGGKALYGDVLAGLTAGVVALPLALAFGVASGAGAAAGLYGAMALGFFASLFGGTPTQISGPTGPMTVVMASTVVALSGHPQAIVLVVVLAGVLQIIFGLVRLGGYVRYIPYPVISGFMSGIGVIIILLQLHPLLGGMAVKSPVEAVATLPTLLTELNPSAVLLAVVSMVIVFFTPPRITRVLPSPLIALVVGTVLSQTLGLTVDTIGEVPAGLPTIYMPGLGGAALSQVLGLALTLALLGCIDTLLTSIVADSLTKTRHNSNLELFGQGIGNMAAGLMGGLPGAGATMRTVVNIKAGGTSRVAGMIHALLLAVILLGAGPLAALIPMPVLAGILMKVGVDILDYRLLKVLRKAPRQDLIVMLVVFGMTVFVDLIVAVAAGITLAALLVTARLARQTQINITEVKAHTDALDQERAVETATDYRVKIVDVRGPFFFGTTAQMQDKIATLLGTKVVVVNCLEVPFIDISAAFALGEMIMKLRESGIKVLLAGGDELLARLANLGYEDMLGNGNMCPEMGVCLARAQALADQPRTPKS